MSFLSELRRRNVLRVSIAYLAGAWLLIQIVETLSPVFGLSEAGFRVVVIALAVGFVPALVLAWVFELTPGGLARDRGAATTDNKGFDRIIIALLAVAVAYFSVDKFLLDPARDEKRVAEVARQVRSDVLTESFADRSIAILPFENMSADAGNEYFADGIGHAHLISGHPDTALKMFEVALHEVHRQLGFLMAFHGQGRQAEFKELFAKFEQQAEWDQHAFVYAWIGDADKAFELLEKGYAQFPGDFSTLFSDTRLMRIHDDPRWRKLMERIGTTPEQLAAIKLELSVPN